MLKNISPELKLQAQLAYWETLCRLKTVLESHDTQMNNPSIGELLGNILHRILTAELSGLRTKTRVELESCLAAVPPLSRHTIELQCIPPGWVQLWLQSRFAQPQDIEISSLRGKDPFDQAKEILKQVIATR